MTITTSPWKQWVSCPGQGNQSGWFIYSCSLSQQSTQSFFGDYCHSILAIRLIIDDLTLGQSLYFPLSLSWTVLPVLPSLGSERSFWCVTSACDGFLRAVAGKRGAADLVVCAGLGSAGLRSSGLCSFAQSAANSAAPSTQRSACIQPFISVNSELFLSVVVVAVFFFFNACQNPKSFLTTMRRLVWRTWHGWRIQIPCGV